MCCMRLATNTGPKKVARNRHLGTIAQICRAISSQLRHVSTIGKNLLSSHISFTCPRNMVNLGSLAAEIVSLVWYTPGNFNGFRVLAALLQCRAVTLSKVKVACRLVKIVFSRLLQDGAGSHLHFPHSFNSGCYCHSTMKIIL